MVPKKGVFFSATMTVANVSPANVVTPMVRGVDFLCIEFLHQTTYELGKEIHAAVLVINPNLTGKVRLTYQALGGAENVDQEMLYVAYNTVGSVGTVDWHDVIHPVEFPAAAHKQDSSDVYGMEYVRDAIVRVKDAINIGDHAFHQKLVTTDWSREAARFFQTFNTSFNSSLDLIYLNVDSSDTALKASAKSLENVDAYCSDVDSLDIVNSKAIQSHQFAYENTHKSAAMALLLKKQFEKYGTLMDVPKYISDLNLWIDLTDTDTIAVAGNTTTVTDKSFSARKFTTQNVVFALDSNLGTQCGEFTQNSNLSLSTGPALSISNECTIAFVTSRLGAALEAINLLYSTGSVISCNVDQAELVKFTIDETTPVLAGCDWRDNYTAHVVVLCLNKAKFESGCFSNSPRSVYTDHYGLEYVKDFTTKMFTQIGGGAQNCKLHELLIYNSQLSKYDVDILGVYFQYKYGLRFNLLANGNFNDGLSEFETDYAIGVEAQEPGSIASFLKENVTSDLGYFAKFFVIPNYSNITRQMPVNNKFLIVNTSLDATKAFRRDSVKLDAYTSYKLTLSVLYNPENAPAIAIKINGEQVGLVYQLSRGMSRMNDVEFSFTTDHRRVTTIELINTNVSGPINTFGVDNVTLRRSLVLL